MPTVSKDEAQIVWKCHLWADGSSAIISRQLVLALDRAGAPIRVLDLSPHRSASKRLDADEVARLKELTIPQIGSGIRAAVRCAAVDPGESGLIQGAWNR